jgi:hypothetical protein
MQKRISQLTHRHSRHRRRRYCRYKKPQELKMRTPST